MPRARNQDDAHGDDPHVENQRGEEEDRCEQQNRKHQRGPSQRPRERPSRNACDRNGQQQNHGAALAAVADRRAAYLQRLQCGRGEPRLVADGTHCEEVAPTVELRHCSDRRTDEGESCDGRMQCRTANASPECCAEEHERNRSQAVEHAAGFDMRVVRRVELRQGGRRAVAVGERADDQIGSEIENDEDDTGQRGEPAEPRERSRFLGPVRVSCTGLRGLLHSTRRQSSRCGQSVHDVLLLDRLAVWCGLGRR